MTLGRYFIAAVRAAVMLAITTLSICFAIVMLSLSDDFLTVAGWSLLEVTVVYLTVGLWVEYHLPVIARWIDDMKEASA